MPCRDVNDEKYQDTIFSEEWEDDEEEVVSENSEDEEDIEEYVSDQEALAIEAEEEYASIFPTREGEADNATVKHMVIGNKNFFVNIDGTVTSGFMTTFGRDIRKEGTPYRVVYADVFGPRRVEILIHDIVWRAFNGAVPSNWEVVHIDTSTYSNALSNLRVQPKCEPYPWEKHYTY